MTSTASYLEQFRANRQVAKNKFVVAGFDGFIDRIVTPVSLRFGSGERFAPIGTMVEFGNRVAEAAGKSTNIELYQRMEKLGGNGPIMANALLTSGVCVKYVGALGANEPHPALADFAKRSSAVTLCDPGYTTAIEFTDGKLMLGMMAGFDELSYRQISKRLGGESGIVELLSRADLVALLNWTMLPHMTAIFQSLEEYVLPLLPAARGRRFFFDLADPEKRSDTELREALHCIGRFTPFGQVTLGLNLKEAEHVARLLGLAHSGETPDSLKTLAHSLRERLEIGTVVVHPRKSAACATENGSFWMPGPYCEVPLVSTGAGDHFNAGFSLGQLLGLSPEACLATGVGTSGYYVRTGKSPNLDELETFLGQLDHVNTT